MQLFYTPFEILGNKIHIENRELLSQIRKVLRLDKGSYFFVQNEFDGKIIRCQIILEKRTDKDIFGEIINQEIKNIDNKTKSMIIAMPNKRAKVELITQKLTEIGIRNIIFWPSERSIIRISNENKIKRLKKISKEALEQSWGRYLPNISFQKNIEKNIENQGIIVFDKKNDEDTKENNKNIYNKQYNLGIVGPEGGFTFKDYKIFGNNIYIKQLGKNILRTETACIVGAWLLIN